MPWEPSEDPTLARFSRQLVLPEVGPAGQAALAAASVLVVGAGGLGHPVLTYLAAAGVGHLVVLDADEVEVSNLPRQVLFEPGDVGRPKVEVVAERLGRLAPGCRVAALPRRYDPEVALEALHGVTLAVDASDNFATRFLLNDACRLAGVPLVHGGLTRFGGLVTTFAPAGPCYRCFFSEPPRHGRIPACGEAGVLGPAAGLVGSWQALEAIKWALGARAQALVGRVLLVDLWEALVETVRLPRKPDCLLCGEAPEITRIDPDDPTYAQARQMLEKA
ncbi:MAG: HesA/MoeB/ThiF family protein [Candidatus Sericytochromatia bacterium]|nr:HesA/MoeB/ThiF family protein [Candidatus Sericytochromatia bacterium]